MNASALNSLRALAQSQHEKQQKSRVSTPRPMPAPLPQFSSPVVGQAAREKVAESLDEGIFDRYKRQVDELCESMRMDRTDLLFFAIDYLYSKYNDGTKLFSARVN